MLPGKVRTLMRLLLGWRIKLKLLPGFRVCVLLCFPYCHPSNIKLLVIMLKLFDPLLFVVGAAVLLNGTPLLFPSFPLFRYSVCGWSSSAAQWNTTAVPFVSAAQWNTTAVPFVSAVHRS